MTGAEGGPTFGWRATMLVLLLVVGLHALSPSVQVGDSRLSVPVATQVLHQRTMDLDEVPAVQRLTDRYDSLHDVVLESCPGSA